MSRPPKLGDRVIFLPRVAYGRQSELAGIVTQIVDPDLGAVNIIVFPSNSEPQHISNVIRRNEKVQIHCWDFVDDISSEDVPKRRGRPPLNRELVTAE